MNKDEAKTLVKVIIPILTVLLCILVIFLLFFNKKEETVVQPESNTEVSTEVVEGETVVINNAVVLERIGDAEGVSLRVKDQNGEYIIRDFVKSGAARNCEDYFNRTLKITAERNGNELRFVSCEYDGYVEKEVSVSEESTPLLTQIEEVVGKGHIFSVNENLGAGLDYPSFLGETPIATITKTLYLNNQSSEEPIIVKYYEFIDEESAKKIYDFLSGVVENNNLYSKSTLIGNRVASVIASDEEIATKIINILSKEN